MSTKYLREADWPGWAYLGLTLLATPPLAALVSEVLEKTTPTSVLGWYTMLIALVLVLNFVNLLVVFIMRIGEGEWPWQ